MFKKLLRNNNIFIILTVIYFPLFKYYINLNNSNGHSFLTSDWLINYNYGFVKRGLPGTLFFHLTEDPEILLDIISGSLITIYIFIFYFLNKTFQVEKQNLISIILILSPAAFLFPIYDSQGAFRKEIIGILALLIVSSCSKKGKYKQWLILSSTIYTIGLFSHSVNIFFLTTIIYILYKFYKSRDIIDYVIFVIPTVLYLTVYILFSASEEKLYFIRDNICNDLREIGLFNLCGFGSFDFLVWDINANFVITQNYVINENRDAHYLYILLFFISLIPYLFDKYFYKYILPFSLIGITFLPLFLFAIDWGRWIYIISICYLSIYLLSKKKLIGGKLVYVLLFFPIFFELEHCCKPRFEFNLNYFMQNLDFLIFNFENIFFYKII